MADVPLGTPATSFMSRVTARVAVLITFLVFELYLVLFQLETGLLQSRTLLGVSPEDRAAAVNQVRTGFRGQANPFWDLVG